MSQDGRTQRRQNAPPEFFGVGEHSKILPNLVDTVWFWVSSYESNLLVSKTNLLLLPGLDKLDFQRFHRIFTDFGGNIMLSMCVVLSAENNNRFHHQCLSPVLPGTDLIVLCACSLWILHHAFGERDTLDNFFSYLNTGRWFGRKNVRI